MSVPREQGWVVLMAARGRGEDKKDRRTGQVHPECRVLESQAGQHRNWETQRQSLLINPPQLLKKEGCVSSWTFPAEYTECCPNLPRAHLLLSDCSDPVVPNIQCFVL